MRDTSNNSGLPWGVYLMEGGLLGIFMVSACVATVVLEHPNSPVHAAIASGVLRRLIIGVAMGVTAFFLLRSGWAKRTGAHMNPAVTLAAWRMGKLSARDSIGYVAGQFCGAVVGVGLVQLTMGAWLANSAVNYAVTTPGSAIWVVWGAEFVISFALLSVLLTMNRFSWLMSWCPVMAGALIALYIVVEAPISGMSMNPARTIGSAVFANTYAGLWIYFTAPPAGMLVAVEVQKWFIESHHHLCLKPVHDHRVDCHCKCECHARHARLNVTL